MQKHIHMFLDKQDIGGYRTMSEDGQVIYICEENQRQRRVNEEIEKQAAEFERIIEKSERERKRRKMYRLAALVMFFASGLALAHAAWIYQTFGRWLPTVCMGLLGAIFLWYGVFCDEQSQKRSVRI